MELVLQSIEEKILTKKLDFTEEVKNWFKDKGYVRVVDRDHYSYNKGILKIEPENIMTSNGIRLVIIESLYLTKWGRCYIPGSHEPQDYDLGFKEYEKKFMQALEDINAFYKRWFNTNG